MKINEDMTVAGKVTAEQLDGEPIGKLRSELDKVGDNMSASVGNMISELSEQLDKLGTKLDTIIALIGKIIENKEKQEEIL